MTVTAGRPKTNGQPSATDQALAAMLAGESMTSGEYAARYGRERSGFVAVTHILQAAGANLSRIDPGGPTDPARWQIEGEPPTPEAIAEAKRKVWAKRASKKKANGKQPARTPLPATTRVPQPPRQHRARAPEIMPTPGLGESVTVTQLQIVADSTVTIQLTTTTGDTYACQVVAFAATGNRAG